MRKAVLTSIFLWLSLNKIVNAQDMGVILYHMRSLPQSILYNPALIPEQGGYFNFGVPFPDAHLHFNSNGLTLNNILTIEGDKKVIDVPSLLSSLSSYNRLSASMRVALVDVGFHYLSHYFGIGIAVRGKMEIGLNKGSFELLEHVGGNNKIELGLSSQAWTEISFTYARRQNPHPFYWGVRPKLLLGSFSSLVSMEVNSLYDRGVLNMATQVFGRFSSALHPSFAWNKDRGDFSWGNIDILRGIFPLGQPNIGTALDIGIRYRFSEAVEMKVSAVDIGFISWTNNTVSLEMDSTIQMKGVTLSSKQFQDLILQNGITSADKGIDEITGNFKRSLNYSQSPYVHWLYPKIYMGLSYHFISGNSLGGLFLVEFPAFGRTETSFSLSFNTKPFETAALSLAYTIAPSSYTNLGAVFSTYIGPVQLYAGSDNLIGLMVPKASNKPLNLHFGISFLFDRHRPPDPFFHGDQENDPLFHGMMNTN